MTFRVFSVKTILVRPAKWSTIVRGLLFLALMATPGLLLHAQTSTTGDITGVVTDPTGAVIPNAKVVLTSVDSRGGTPTMTDAQGLYRFPLLKPGNYSVQASASGFQIANRTVTVILGSSVSVNLTLSISSSQEAVDVTSAVVGVQTEDGNIETNFDASAVTA
jgi:hypothetical protein